MNTQYRKNLKSAMTVCKNYTDQKAEEILWQLAENDVSTSDDNTTASTKTVPSNATRCKIKRIYGLTQKFNPSVASDITSYSVKTMPSTVYDFDVSKVDGASYKYNQLVQETNKSKSFTTSTTQAVNIQILSINSMDKLFVVWKQNTTLTSATRNTPLLYSGGNTQIQSENTNYNLSQGLKTWLVTSSYSNPTLMYWANAISDNLTIDDIQVFNLTKIFGSGNEPSDVTTATSELLKRGIDISTYNEYNTGEIHNFAWTGVKVEGANKKDLSYPSVSYYRNNSTDFNTTDSSATDRIRTGSFEFNYVANKTYYLNNIPSGITLTSVRVYDSQQNYLGATNTGATTISGNSFTIVDTNTKYIHFLFSGSGFNDNTKTLFNQIGIFEVNNFYVPYVAPTTKTIDLSTILYNGSPLFEGNSLKGVGNVADEITPYKAIKRFGIVDLSSLTWNDYFRDTTGHSKYANAPSNIKVGDDTYVINAIIPNYEIVGFNSLAQWTAKDKVLCGVDNAKRIIIRDTSDIAPSGYLVYELDTPIEVSIDWSATLRHITGYSNGTITLLNTNNQDTDNTITYNSIIKENCCAKIVQSRGGNVVKTINLTSNEAKYGWSADSIFNNRDYTINTNNGIQYVGRIKLNQLDYIYNAQNSVFFAYINQIDNIKPKGACVIANYLFIVDSNITDNDSAGNRLSDKQFAFRYGTTDRLYFKDLLYTDATTYKNHFGDNDYLYFELDEEDLETITSIDNIIEVEPSDVLSFYDENDNLVTVPSDITYRIEVAE